MNLEIFILCHNRPELAKETIQSVLAQNSAKYRLVISDNSTNEAVQEMVQINFPGLDYRRRPSDLSALQHFNTCIKEANSDYFCLFHDDDIMFNFFVYEAHKGIATYPTAIAIGTNARVKNIDGKIRKFSFFCFGSFEQIRTPKELFYRYFGQYSTGIAHFPGYIYKTKATRDSLIPVDGGKYADVSWLLTLASIGKIVWIAKPLFEYRFHGNNDGLQESTGDRLHLLGFLKKNKDLCGENGLADYRYFFYNIIKDSLSFDHFSKRMKTMNKFMSRHRVSRLLRGTNYFFMVKRSILKHVMKQGGFL